MPLPHLRHLRNLRMVQHERTWRSSMAPVTRIAFVSEHASPIALLGGEDAGGQNVYIDEVGRQLGELGYAVDIFTRRDSQAIAEVVDWAPGVRVVHVDAGPPAALPKDELWPHMPAFQRSMLRFMLRSGARYSLLHGHFWMSGWVVSRLRQQLGAPAVQLFHATGITKRRHQGAADTSPDTRIATEREVVRGVDRVIAQCPAERAELIDEYHASPAQVPIIPAAVNARRFRPIAQAEARRAIGLADDGPVVVYVGRMLPRKDVRNVVRAIAELNQRHDVPARLLLVGGDDTPGSAAAQELTLLKALAAELGVAERVRFCGPQQPDRLRFFYGAGDVAVTTPWYEPFGLTPLEAMACGRPVVGSAVGGLTFTIQDGITGALVPPRDPARLALSLRDLLRSPERCRAMGRAARARVEREFTWAMTARRTATLYEALLEERRGPALPPRERAVGEVPGIEW
jgi:D-inositol-3-phosphate glycosyltransferase